MLMAVALTRSPQQPLLLLVEDDGDTRAMYSEFLRGGFDVIEAADGEQALAVLHARVPDLVVTDLSLPGIDGFQLITRIRQEPALREVPIISLSGFGGVRLEQRARQAGCNRVLEKPCLPDTLAQVAADLLRERHRRSRQP